MRGAYYNEYDPDAAAWLRELVRREPDGAIYIASSCTEAQTIQLIEQVKFAMMFDAMVAK